MLQPHSAAAYSELSLVAFDELLGGDTAKMGENSRLAQRSLLAVRELQPQLVPRHLCRMLRPMRDAER